MEIGGVSSPLPIGERSKSSISGEGEGPLMLCSFVTSLPPSSGLRPPFPRGGEGNGVCGT